MYENTNRSRSQAATAHSFGLSELLALQSVTSVPAKSLDLHHRIGYVQPGYDADIAVWNSHPLSAGATPLQVYIDGKATLEENTVPPAANINIESSMRAESVPEDIKSFCTNREKGESVVITGISTSYLDTPRAQEVTGANLTMVIDGGKISCLGAHQDCVSAKSAGRVISLANGHVLPGLTTVSNTLGLVEIKSEESTADGAGDRSANVLDPETAIYNKYGIHFEGKTFGRARVGGVTRSITFPYGDGFLQGVSVGIKTAEGSNPLNGGIFKDDVALHISIGQDAKSMVLSKSKKVEWPVLTLGSFFSNPDSVQVCGHSSEDSE